jgi:phosphoserine phosphatase RsbU/P
VMQSEFSDEVRERLAESIAVAREVSSQTDPQEMVRRYRDHVGRSDPVDATISLSRRGLEYPRVRVTRSSSWEGDVNPWKELDSLPVFKGGLLAELIYGDEPRLVDDLSIGATDPAAEYLHGMRSLMALPLYDGGRALNMVIRLRRDRGAFAAESLPDMVVTSNLFGRATQNLVLAERLREAYEALDREFEAIAAIQKSLLPPVRPVDGLDIASYYATATRAGGDYYDVFPVGDGRTGMVIADVSGHGAAAAVVMARVHAILHAFPGSMAEPAKILEYANEHLLMSCRSEATATTFVTAFMAVFDPATRTLRYSSAGHNPPRLRRFDGAIASVAGASQLPLAIQCGIKFAQADLTLSAHDLILLYTDGIVETFDSRREQFGVDRLDRVMLDGDGSPGGVVDGVVRAVDDFADGLPALDDRTLLAFRVR